MSPLIDVVPRLDEYSVYAYMCIGYSSDIFNVCFIVAIILLSYTVVDCGSPPSIGYGFPGTPTSTTFGGTVTYSCYSGYILSGSATVFCLSTGSWNTRPTCTGM